jgi:hypothetical protein
MNRRPSLKTVLGQPSWTITSDDVQLSVTRTGGHVAPVVFDRRGRKIAPYSIAPWHDEKLPAGTPPLIKVLRGDFFCMPFGGNQTPYRDEKYPLHGETANRAWRLIGASRADDCTELHLRIETNVRSGRVDKLIRLVDGHNVVYSRHVVAVEAGPMCFAHHAMLKFPDEPNCGLISTSPFKFGQVFPEPVEQPENRGYSILKPGAEFDSLANVPTITGEPTDLSSYPARRGYEDAVQILNEPDADFAWTAVSFPKLGYVWFSFKDPRVLTGTLFWITNGGRHYPPWNGRHVNVLGLEELTGYFFYGLHESARDNPFTRRGFKTAFRMDPKRPLAVNMISGVALTPSGFDRVQSIEPYGAGVRLSASSGKRVDVPVDVQFLKGDAV